MSAVLGAAGFLLLFAGGELVVRGGLSLARRLGVSTLIIGLVVIGFATSAPELVVSLAATLESQPELALGNVVGSTIANLLLILGIAAVVRPLSLSRGGFHQPALMVGAIAALAAAGLLSGLGRVAGAAFVAALAVHLAVSYARERRSPVEVDEEEVTGPPATLARAVPLLAAGLVALIAGGQLLVTGAVGLARELGVPEAVIGLTLVALGTSLPEIATSATAAMHGHGDIAAGNVIGSNLFNVLGILGLVAIVRPLPIPAAMARVDIPFALILSLLLLPVLAGKVRLGRPAGGVMLAAYAGYVLVRFA